MRRLAIHAAIALATLAGLYLFWLVRKAVLLFLLSLAIAAALRPSVRFLARRKFPSWAAIGGTYLIALGVPALLLSLAGRPLVAQMKSVAADVARAYEQIERSGKEGFAWGESLAARLPSPEQIYAALVGESTADVLSAALGATFSVFGAAVDLVLTIFLSVYWTIDQVRFERLWLSLLPAPERAEMRELWRNIETKAGAYVRSEAIQTISAGLILWLGYVALGQPYPVLLAMIGGLAWLIPWVGALIAVAAVALLSLPMLIVEGPEKLLSTTLPAALLTFAVLLALELAIEPRFFNRRRYNSLATALVAIGMAEVWGLFGLLLGPPVAVILQIAAWQGMHRQSSESEPPVSSRETLEQRLQAIRAEIGRLQSPRPKLLSYLARLEKLIAEARRFDSQTASASTTPASAGLPD